MAGFYERRIFPWINEKLAGTPEITRLRVEVLASARGRVLEIGFGSGANLPHYPAQVESILAIEPNQGMYDRAAKLIAKAHTPIDTLLAPAEVLPVADKSVDTAVSTLTLCSVSDPDRVLAELRRVLRDDGVLIMMEHGLSSDPGVARWQHRLNGIQNVLDTLKSFYVPNIPRTHGWFTVGAARKERPDA